MKKLMLLSVVLLIFGCAVNPYFKFYTDNTNGVDLTTLPNVIISDSEPKIFQGDVLTKDTQSMKENNFNLVGYSSFNGGQVNNQKAIMQAKNVKAEVVIVYSEYTNTVSGTIPLTLPDKETSTTTTSGNLWGVGSYSETSKTTTNKSKTYNIPYNVNRYNYGATYWVKMKEPTFGIHIRPLENDERYLINSNKGVYITAVINNSPAFMADIFAGDVLKQIGDIEIINNDSFQQALQSFKSESINVIIWRNGELITKRVLLNDYPFN